MVLKSLLKREVFNMARPIDATKKEFIGYEAVTVTIPWRIKEKLDKLPKGTRAQFIREAIDEKLKKMSL